VWARHWTSSRRSIVAWICSIALFRRRLRTWRGLHLTRLFCSCGVACTSSRTARSTHFATAPLVRGIRGLTSITSRRPANTSLATPRPAQSLLLPPTHARYSQSILEDRFLELYREKRAFLHESDADHPIKQQKPSGRCVSPRELRGASGAEGFASIRQISSGEIMHARRLHGRGAPALH
jgi:hypothetical protein